MSEKAIIVFATNSRMRKICSTIVCDNDGDIKHVGKILYNCYKLQNDVVELIVFGNIERLGATIKDSIFHRRDNNKKWIETKAKSINCGGKYHRLFNLYPDCKWRYIFNNGKWYYSYDSYELHELNNIVINEYGEQND